MLAMAALKLPPRRIGKGKGTETGIEIEIIRV